MKRMHGRDANFLFQETPTALMHTIKIHILKAPDESVQIDDVTAGLGAILHRVPIMRHRVVFVPFGLHHPVYIEDPDFNVDSHIFHAGLPAPGGMKQLEDMIAQIASKRLDHDRPLWELWVLEGLEDDRIAIIHKVHHCLADGMASVGFISKAWGSEPDEEEDTNWHPEPIPSSRRLLWDALVDHVRYDAIRFPGMVRALYKSIRNLTKLSKSAVSPTIDALSNELPRLPWNYALSNKRGFATTQIPIDDVRSLKDKLNGTINDVVLALAAGTVREYLIAENCLPSDPLMIAIPVAVDEKGHKREAGNNTASLMTKLHTQIADPIERFKAIQQSTSEGKAELDAMGRLTYQTVIQYIPPGLLSWFRRKEFREHGANKADYKVQTNMTVSNVPGPRDTLTGLGGGMLDLYSIGPLIEGNGLNITVWSYAGKLSFSVLACRKAVPNVSVIADGIKDAFNELNSACD